MLVFINKMIFDWLASDGGSETCTFEWASLSVPTVEQLKNRYDNYIADIQHFAGAKYSFTINANIGNIKVDCEEGHPIGNNVYFRCHCVNIAE
jgi:hypothetical protein